MYRPAANAAAIPAIARRNSNTPRKREGFGGAATGIDCENVRAGTGTARAIGIVGSVPKGARCAAGAGVDSVAVCAGVVAGCGGAGGAERTAAGGGTRAGAGGGGMSGIGGASPRPESLPGRETRVGESVGTSGSGKGLPGFADPHGDGGGGPCDGFPRGGAPESAGRSYSSADAGTASSASSASRGEIAGETPVVSSSGSANGDMAPIRASTGGPGSGSEEGERFAPEANGGGGSEVIEGTRDGIGVKGADGVGSAGRNFASGGASIDQPRVVGAESGS